MDVQKFFTALGSGSKDIVPEDSAGGDDQVKFEEYSSSIFYGMDLGGKRPYGAGHIKNFL